MIKEFAEYLSLTIWDWLAVSVAFCSLFVACLSYYIARRTLKSQQQTEKNTMPIINTSIQEFLLREFIIKLFDGHIKITAIWYLLNDKKYNNYPSEQILDSVKIPQTYIHCELFYNNPSFFRTIEGLEDMVNEYNCAVATLNNHLHENTINNDIYYKEFKNLIHINDRIARTWDKTMSILFNYGINEKSKAIAPFIKDVSQEEIDNTELKYYSQDEVYTTLFVSEVDKQKLLAFMQLRTVIYYNEFKEFLIDK